MLAAELPAYMIGAIGVEARLAEGIDRGDLQRVDRMQLAVEEIRKATCSLEDPFDSSERYTDVIMSSLENIDVAQGRSMIY